MCIRDSRFNRAQQDGFLPYVESGLVTLIGATTENPSFELNGAVLSRARVFVLNRLEDDALNELITRGEVAFDRGGAFDENARKALIAICDGDGRYILNLVGEILGLKSGAINADDVAKFAQRKPCLLYTSRCV